MDASMMARMKELERKNACLKKMYVETQIKCEVLQRKPWGKSAKTDPEYINARLQSWVKRKGIRYGISRRENRNKTALSNGTIGQYAMTG